MGGKPRQPPKQQEIGPSGLACVCGHEEGLHKDGGRCYFYKRWDSPDGTFSGEMFCICSKFRTIGMTIEEVAQINEQS